MSKFEWSVVVSEVLWSKHSRWVRPYAPKKGECTQNTTKRGNSRPYGLAELPRFFKADAKCYSTKHCLFVAATGKYFDLMKLQDGLSLSNWNYYNKHGKVIKYIWLRMRFVYAKYMHLYMFKCKISNLMSVIYIHFVYLCICFSCNSQLNPNPKCEIWNVYWWLMHIYNMSLPINQDYLSPLICCFQWCLPKAEGWKLVFDIKRASISGSSRCH